MNTRHILMVSLWAIAIPIVATAQRADTVCWEHEHKLGEAVVTGLTGKTAQRNAAAPVTVVTRKELQQTSSTNIIDAVAQQPGVSQITTGGGISKPVVRGMGYNRVVVVDDGVRQEGQQWGDEHGVEIDAQSVGSVEILKGPASLLYGSDAMAGVLVMHSPSLPPLGALAGSAAGEYQSNNGLFAYSVNAAGHHDGFVWSSRWSQKMAHAYKNARDGYVGGTQFRERAFTQLIGLNKRWGYSRLTLSYYHLTPSVVEGEDDEEGASPSLTHLLQTAPFVGEEQSRGERTADDETAANPKRYGIAAPYQQINHYKAVLDNTVFIGEGSLKALVGYQQNRRQEYEEDDACGLDFRLHTVNYDVRYTSPALPDGWKFVAGTSGMYQRSLNEGTEYLVPAYRLFDYGLFATTSYDRGRWHLSGGLRYDRRHLTSFALSEDGEARFSRFARHFSGLTGSIGAVFNASRRLNLRLNLARGFRAPNVSELASNGEHEGTGRYEIGNHDLQAETSLQADFGVDFSLPWLFVQASLFANRIDNYIFLERIGDPLITHNSQFSSKREQRRKLCLWSLPSAAENARSELITEANVYRFSSGDACQLGGELLVDVHPVARLHFENTLSYVDAVQLGKHGGERYLPFTPAPRWTSCLRYDIQPRCNAFASVGIECNLAQHHAHTAGGTETATPSYTLVNASAGTDLLVRGRTVATLTLTATNLFDRAYQSHLSRLKYIGPGYCNMGRNVGIKLSIPIEND